MSTQASEKQLSSSVNCPRLNDRTSIERVTARSAEVGGGIAVSRLLPSGQRQMIGARSR